MTKKQISKGMNSITLIKYLISEFMSSDESPGNSKITVEGDFKNLIKISDLNINKSCYKSAQS